MKVDQVLFRRSLTADALGPRDTSRRGHPTSTTYGLKRVAGAIGRQIPALKATVAKFKKMRLPPRRLPIFSTKEAPTPSQTDRPLLAEQSKTTEGPLLPASSFHSPEEGPQLEKDQFKVMETQLSSGSGAQVKQIFSMGSRPVSENDVVRYVTGGVAPPKATPEARLPSILEL